MKKKVKSEVATKSPQEFYDAFERIKTAIKLNYEEIQSLYLEYIKQYKLDLEYPIEMDGKKKWMRLYAPDGQYVYNREFEIGTRLKPENPAPEAK